MDRNNECNLDTVMDGMIDIKKLMSYTLKKGTREISENTDNPTIVIDKVISCNTFDNPSQWKYEMDTYGIDNKSMRMFIISRNYQAIEWHSCYSDSIFIAVGSEEDDLIEVGEAITFFCSSESMVYSAC